MKIIFGRRHRCNFKGTTRDLGAGRARSIGVRVTFTLHCRAAVSEALYRVRSIVRPTGFSFGRHIRRKLDGWMTLTLRRVADESRFFPRDFSKHFRIKPRRRLTPFIRYCFCQLQAASCHREGTRYLSGCPKREPQVCRRFADTDRERTQKVFEKTETEKRRNVRVLRGVVRTTPTQNNHICRGQRPGLSHTGNDSRGGNEVVTHVSLRVRHVESVGDLEAIHLLRLTTNTHTASEF